MRGPCSRDAWSRRCPVAIWRRFAWKRLEISRSEIDRLAGFTDGYARKLLGNGNSVREKRMRPTGLDLMLGVLGLKILLIEDEAATPRTISLRAPVLRSHQRFGNKCNSKPPPALEAPAPIIPPMRSPPISMSALSPRKANDADVSKSSIHASGDLWGWAGPPPGQAATPNRAHASQHSARLRGR